MINILRRLSSVCCGTGTQVPKVRFADCQECPIIGLGTWKSKPGEVTQAVKDAIDIGYRHIDCAHVYGNEKEVGEGIGAKLKEGVVKREELFVTSKLWNTFHKPSLVRGALQVTLKNLQLEYLNLYLIHWPVAYKEGESLFPEDACGKMVFSNVDYVDTWKAFEEVQAEGLVCSLGISNFNSKQVTRVLEAAKVKPVINQIECHPYLNQQKMMAFCKARGIMITAYSPLGSADRPWAKPGEPKLIEDTKLVAMADRLKKTPAQILIRYQIERGNIVIPKSVTKARIKSNFDVFNFQLSQEDMCMLNCFDCNGRMVPETSAFGHPLHPFEHLKSDEF